jgi:hypothetical protein
LQAASGSANTPIEIASRSWLRMFAPRLPLYNTANRPMFTAFAMKFV